MNEKGRCPFDAVGDFVPIGHVVDEALADMLPKSADAPRIGNKGSEQKARKECASSIAAAPKLSTEKIARFLFHLAVVEREIHELKTILRTCAGRGRP